jgi:hypothetical protein
LAGPTVKPLSIVLSLACVLVASATAGACAGTEAAAGLDAGSGLPPPEDGMVPGDGNGEGSGLTTSMRLANIAPRLGIIDLCIQAPGANGFGEPLFSAPDSGGGPSDAGSFFDVQEEEDAEASDASGLEAGADTSTIDARVPEAGVLDSTTEASDASEEASSDAGEPAPDAGVGLAPLAMSRYYELANAGTFVFAIVPYGAGSCDAPLFTQEVTLDPGKRITIVLAPALPTSFDAGRADAETADAGHVATTPLHRLLVFTDEPSTASLALSWTSATGDLDLMPGTVHTGFIVGEGLQAFRVLWCDDQAQAPLLTPCLVLGP